jgi:hypothetical protein
MESTQHSKARTVKTTWVPERKSKVHGPSVEPTFVLVLERSTDAVSTTTRKHFAQLQGSGDVQRVVEYKRRHENYMPPADEAGNGISKNGSGRRGY